MKLIKDKKKHVRRLEESEINHAFKMMGNEYRMNMLIVLKNLPGLTLEQINQRVGGDFKNIAMHMQKLSNAGLVNKKYEGRYVHHFLTIYGKRAVDAYTLFTKDIT